MVEIPEEQVDALSAISGSGRTCSTLPRRWLPPVSNLALILRLSLMISRETVAGAGFMLAEPGADPTALRIAVTSPNGTTERAIAALTTAAYPRSSPTSTGQPRPGLRRSRSSSLSSWPRLGSYGRAANRSSKSTCPDTISMSRPETLVFWPGVGEVFAG